MKPQRLSIILASLIVIPFTHRCRSISQRSPCGATLRSLRSIVISRPGTRGTGRYWATSLHFPHVRPGPGAFEMTRTPEEYAKGVDFEATLKTGWHSYASG